MDQTQNLENLWMPFSANRVFKSKPRLMNEAKGMYYKKLGGESVLDANIVVALGDVINWNYAYFTISSLNENQLIGGMQNQNFSVIATGYLTRLSSLGIENVRTY